jgi:hypothetical protein
MAKTDIEIILDTARQAAMSRALNALKTDPGLKASFKPLEGTPAFKKAFVLVAAAAYRAVALEVSDGLKRS